ncbi:GyrI-like domain-containing protein [Agromyces mangrovi Wang et al. 2018]|uniref:GyrI-like domain-containing protein n=1 Tax=Agromyces mangrovi TaxID=1858653 RepID=UPI0025744240|nr:GyrI-like domain-containing protein [Agromyces mangrovi]BDZ63459.1 transcription activator effector-binding protein [Agromyces mangrovi]
MTEITIAERAPQPTAGIRETVPMDQLPEFFGRAFHATMEAMRAQGVAPAGPPFGKYHGVPGATADVEAGVPVAGAFETAGDVVARELPGGMIASALHVGPYDTLGDTYDAIRRHIVDEGRMPGGIMWECYVSDPEEEPDPATWRTDVCWLVV